MEFTFPGKGTVEFQQVECYKTLVSRSLSPGQLTTFKVLNLGTFTNSILAKPDTSVCFERYPVETCKFNFRHRKNDTKGCTTVTQVLQWKTIEGSDSATSAS